MGTAPARTVSVSIACDPETVYAYVVDARNLPRWAPGFARAVQPEGGGWRVDTAAGPVHLAFVADNALGVADHRVTAGDVDMLNPMRVIANGDGAEVLFTLFRRPEVPATDFERDVALVTEDLRTLQRLLEGRARPPSR